MKRWANVVLLLGQRRRRWASSKSTLAQRLMFAGLPLKILSNSFIILFRADHNHNYIVISGADVSGGTQIAIKFDLLIGYIIYFTFSHICGPSQPS